MAYASIGTDTGGSIRIPSAACGLVGLKPMFREVSTHGVVPLSSSLDHVGPLCATVADAAAIFREIADAPGEVAIPSAPSARGLRFGVPRRYFLDLLDDEVARAFDDTCARLTEAGAILDDVVIPHASTIPAVYVHIALTEAAAFHSRTLDTQPADYTPTVRQRLEAGRYVLAEDYIRAQQGRHVLRREVAAALEGRDALLLPSMAVPATALGASTVRVSGVDEPVRNVTLRLTQLFNITGHAAISLPCGTTAAGLPIGAQLAGASTAAVLQVAAALESLARGQAVARA
jgi:aspartyl-tRNA(Asn)/glutamyl-tRNA(Gln) amidotransferase subunit A